ncbi:hypothetical protein [Alienimonas sp. DA493]|uniref:hypothetical protein n=1 Tax=Alienimonas sp. DA493 TaxID=3373605 RepID=UPI003754450D
MPDLASAALRLDDPAEAAQAADAVAGALTLGKPLYRKRDVQWLEWYAALPPVWPRWAANNEPGDLAFAALYSEDVGGDLSGFARAAVDLLASGEQPPPPFQFRFDAATCYSVYSTESGEWRFVVASLRKSGAKKASDRGLPDPIRRHWAEHAPPVVAVTRSTRNEPTMLGVPKPLVRRSDCSGDPDVLDAALAGTDWVDFSVRLPWTDLAPFALPVLRELPDDPTLESADVRPGDLDRTGLLSVVAGLEPRLGRPLWTQFVTAFPPLGPTRKPRWSPFERPDDAPADEPVRFPLYERQRGDFLTRLDVLHPSGRPGEIVLDLQQLDRSPRRRAAAKLAEVAEKTGRDFEPWNGAPWGRWE